MSADPIRPALTVKDLTVALGLGTNTVLRMCRAGDLPVVLQRGGKYTVPAAAFDAWCAERGRLAALRQHQQPSGARPRLIQTVPRRDTA